MSQFSGAELESALSTFWISAPIGGVAILIGIVWFSRLQFADPDSFRLAMVYWSLSLGSLCLGNVLVPGLVWNSPGSGCFLTGVHHRWIPGVGLSTPAHVMLLAVVACILGNRHARRSGSMLRFSSLAWLPAFWLSGNVIAATCIGYPGMREIYQFLLQGYLILSGIFHLRDITMSWLSPVESRLDS